MRTFSNQAAVIRNSEFLLIAVFLFGWFSSEARAQQSQTGTEVWPEVDVYVNLKPKIRLYLLGTVSKAVEDGEVFNGQAYEAQFGAHLDYIPNQHLILRAGYRFGTSLGNQDDPYQEHRLLTEQTLRKMLSAGLLLSDRNREDFRFVNGDFSFRYRNRVRIEREFQLKHRSVTPYAAGEIFYDTRYGIWNRNRLSFGVETSLRRGPLKVFLPRRQAILDIYYLRQNDSRADTAHVNALGIALAFYF